MNWIKQLLKSGHSDKSQPLASNKDPTYCALWNMLLAQHTFNQMDRSDSAKIFMDASMLLMNNNLKAVDVPNNDINPEDAIIEKIAASTGHNISPRFTEVGTWVLWVFMAKAMEQNGIKPNFGCPSTLSWREIGSIPEILNICETFDETTARKVVSDLKSNYNIALPIGNSD